MRKATHLQFDQGTLVLREWTQAGVESVFGEEHPWKWDQRADAFRCEAWHYAAIQARLTLRAWEVEDWASAWPVVDYPENHLPPPRPQQHAAIDHWLPQRRGVVVMPTGTGKTEVALHLMARLPVATLIVSPVRDLMYQWHRRIQQGLGYDAGVIGDNSFDVRPVSVTTYDSAAIHAATLGNRFQLLIFDECHHLPGEFRRDAARMSLAPWRLGLTATPERSDGRQADLSWLIGPTVYNLPLAEVSGTVLADYEVFRIPVYLNAQEQTRYDQLSNTVRDYVYQRKQEDPLFRWSELCAESALDPSARAAVAAFRQKQSIEDRASEKLRVLEDLFRLHRGTPMIVFTGSNAMAFEISRRFLLPCLLSHCGKKERAEILGGLQDGSYPAVIANQVLDEGVDMPAVKVAVVVGGSASTKQARQRLGRILRRTGDAIAVLYEVICSDTNEAIKSRRRRKNDAYERTRHRRS
ncbi:MAG: DEAD/DEAH box helicase family protein [Pirellulaceae bacterium]|nr:DEAD/DEAH box helicase family protein [Pirellulaceae bacterium]